MSAALRLKATPRFVDFREAYSLRQSYPTVRFITVKEYANVYGVTVRTAYNWVRSNPLKHNAQKIEGVWRVMVQV